MLENTLYLLKLYVEDADLRSYYEQKVVVHNAKVLTAPHPDSGFDLAVPATTVIEPLSNSLLDMGVKTAMVKINVDDIEPMMTNAFSSLEQMPSGFYMYPRSSLGAKTKLRLANSVGIIDSGYRGNLMASLDNIHPTMAHEAQQRDRLVQICAPDLSPFLIKLVETENELTKTMRGGGGFGSTGLN